MYTQKIFLADDDFEDVQFFTDAVRDISDVITITHAANGQELLDVLYRSNPDPHTDVIFLDLNMPLMNGFECLDAIKNSPALCGLPVIILSTGSDPGKIRQLHDMGAHHYIIKPFSYSELRNTLYKVLAIDFRGYTGPAGFANFLVN